ncbi:MAG TPA: hypothetical protein VGO59_03095 [Verrucomicrobiae bacterium]
MRFWHNIRVNIKYCSENNWRGERREPGLFQSIAMRAVLRGRAESRQNKPAQGATSLFRLSKFFAFFALFAADSFHHAEKFGRGFG